jgi:hypothetical protein
MADSMLRTADDLIAALRQRKDELQLSNAVVDDLAGLVEGHTDKVLGPTRTKKSPNIITLMCLAGALGLAVQLVDDPDSRVQGRWAKRRHQPASNGRISRQRRAERAITVFDAWVALRSTTKSATNIPRNIPALVEAVICP